MSTQSSNPEVLVDAAEAGSSAELDVRDIDMVAIQIVGADTYTGAVSFSGAIGGAAIAVLGLDASDFTTWAASTTNPTNQIWYIPVAGLNTLTLTYTRTGGNVSISAIYVRGLVYGL